MYRPLFAEMTAMDMAIAVAVIFGIFLGIVVIVVFFSFFRLWLQSFTTGAGIGMPNLVWMKLRNVDYAMIVRQKIALVQAGVRVTTGDLESHFLARGNVPKTATAVIAAHKAGLDLPWRTAAAIDLAGRDVLEAVRTSVNPKVIDCPDPAKGKQFLDAVCKNGIQLLAKARVTVRTKLERLVGGATEETIIARVGEGIVKAIGSAHDHKEVLANPSLITQTVLHSGLDSQTAFEIVSVDMADIEVGENIGATLQARQADADQTFGQRRHAALQRRDALLEDVVHRAGHRGRRHLVGHVRHVRPDLPLLGGVPAVLLEGGLVEFCVVPPDRVRREVLAHPELAPLVPPPPLLHAGDGDPRDRFGWDEERCVYDPVLLGADQLRAVDDQDTLVRKVGHPQLRDRPALTHLLDDHLLRLEGLVDQQIVERGGGIPREGHRRQVQNRFRVANLQVRQRGHAIHLGHASSCSIWFTLDVGYATGATVPVAYRKSISREPLLILFPLDYEDNRPRRVRILWTLLLCSS